MREMWRYLLILGLCLSSCGSHPPLVFNVKDILELPAEEYSISAVGIGDDEIYALEHLQGLVLLDLRSVLTPVSDTGLETLSTLSLPNLKRISLGSSILSTYQSFHHP